MIIPSEYLLHAFSTALTHSEKADTFRENFFPKYDVREMISACKEHRNYTTLLEIVLHNNKLMNDQSFLALLIMELIERAVSDAINERVSEKLELLQCFVTLLEKAPKLNRISNEYLVYAVSAVLSSYPGQKSQFLENLFSKYKVAFKNEIKIAEINGTRKRICLIKNPFIAAISRCSEEDMPKVFKLLFKNGAFTKEEQKLWRQQTNDRDPITLYQALLICNNVELIRWVDSQLASASSSGQAKVQDDEQKMQPCNGLDFYKRKVSSFLNAKDFVHLDEVLKLRIFFNQKEMEYNLDEQKQHDLELFKAILPRNDANYADQEFEQRQLCMTTLAQVLAMEDFLEISDSVLNFLYAQNLNTHIIFYLKNCKIRPSVEVLNSIADALRCDLENDVAHDTEKAKEILGLIKELMTQIEQEEKKREELRNEKQKEEQERKKQEDNINLRSRLIDTCIGRNDYVALQKVIDQIDNLSQYSRVNDFIEKLAKKYPLERDVDTQKKIIFLITLITQKSGHMIKVVDDSLTIFNICVDCLDRADMQGCYQLLKALEKIPCDSERLCTGFARALSENPDVEKLKCICRSFLLLWNIGDAADVTHALHKIIHNQNTQTESTQNFCTQLMDCAVETRQYAFIDTFLPLTKRENDNRLMGEIYRGYSTASPQNQVFIRKCLYQLFSNGSRCSESNQLMVAVLIESYRPEHFTQLVEFLSSAQPDLNVDFGKSENSLLPLSLAVKLPLEEEEKLKLIDLLLQEGASVDRVEAKSKKTAHVIAQELRISSKILEKLEPKPVFTHSRYKLLLNQKDFRNILNLLKSPIRIDEARKYEENAQSNLSLLRLSIIKRDLKLFGILLKNKILPNQIVIQEILEELAESTFLVKMLDCPGVCKGFCQCTVKAVNNDRNNEKIFPLYQICYHFFGAGVVDLKKLKPIFQHRLMWFAAISHKYAEKFDKPLLSMVVDRMEDSIHTTIDFDGEKITLHRWIQKNILLLPTDSDVLPLYLEYSKKYPEPFVPEVRTIVQNPLKKKNEPLQVSSEPLPSFAVFLKDKLKDLEGIEEITDLGEKRIRFNFQNKKAYKHARKRFESESVRYELIEKAKPKNSEEEPENPVFAITIAIRKDLKPKNMHSFISYWRELSVKTPYIQEFPSVEIKEKGQPNPRQKNDKTDQVKAKLVAKQQKKEEKRLAEENEKLQNEREKIEKAKQKGKEKLKVKEDESDTSLHTPPSEPPSRPLAEVEIFPYGIDKLIASSSNTSVSTSSTIAVFSKEELERILTARIIQANDCLRDYQTIRNHPEFIEDKTIRLQASSQYLMQACEAICPTLSKKKSRKQQGVDRLLRENVMPSSIFEHIRHALRFNIKLKESDLEELFISFDQLNVKNSLEHYLDEEVTPIEKKLWDNFKKCAHIQRVDVGNFLDNELIAYILNQKQFLQTIKQAVKNEIDAEIRKDSGQNPKNKFIVEKEHYHAAMRKTISDLQKVIVFLEKRFAHRGIKMGADICKQVKWIKEKGTVNAHKSPERLQGGGEKTRVPPEQLWINLMRHDSIFVQLDTWLNAVQELLLT